MVSLRDIRRKIKSVKSIQQITKAMKMVAAARLRKAQSRILSARPFAQGMEGLMTDLLQRLGNPDQHPLICKREGTQRALLLVTSDKGLCGAFNTNLIREALRYAKTHGLPNVHFFIVGRKGRDYFKRHGVTLRKEYVNIFNNLSFAHAEIVTQDLLEAYEKQPFVQVDMLYNEFKSAIFQKVTIKPLLPMASVASVPREPHWPDFIFEPAQEKLLDGLIRRFLKAQVYRVLLESNAAELGARMSAMDNATRNASDLMESLTLRLNRTRQAFITKEILEVVSGAEALK
ncbi:MAG: ATP synthase F1 subunit gamma [Elusimicrobiota bacterium]|jgi:F-type H+-transporting ATPase subunit gamma